MSGEKRSSRKNKGLPPARLGFENSERETLEKKLRKGAENDQIPKEIVKTPAVFAPSPKFHFETGRGHGGIRGTLVRSVIEGLNKNNETKEFEPPAHIQQHKQQSVEGSEEEHQQGVGEASTAEAGGVTSAAVNEKLHLQLTACWENKLSKMSTSSESEMAEEKVYQEALVNWDRAVEALKKTVEAGDPEAMKQAREAFRIVVETFETAAIKYIEKCLKQCKDATSRQTRELVETLNKEKDNVLKQSVEAINQLNVVRGFLKRAKTRETVEKNMRAREAELKRAREDRKWNCGGEDPWATFDRSKEKWAKAHALLLQISGMGDSMAREGREDIVIQFLADLDSRLQEAEDAWDKLTEAALGENRDVDSLEEIHETARKESKKVFNNMTRLLQTTDITGEIRALQDLKTNRPGDLSGGGFNDQAIGGLGRSRSRGGQTGNGNGEIADDWKQVIKPENKHHFYREGLTYKYDKALEPDFKFNGEDDLARFQEWKETMNEFVINNQAMSFNRKVLFLKRFTEGRAKHAIQWVRNTYEGFVEAVETLEAEFGHASQDEVALLNTKLAQAEELNLNEPKTIQNVKDYIKEMKSRVGKADPRSMRIMESAVFGLLKFEDQTAAHWENYLAAREIQIPTLEHFRNWADDLQRRQVRRAQTSQVVKETKKRQARNAKGQFVGATADSGGTTSEDEDDYYREVFGETICATERMGGGKCYHCGQAGHGLMKCQKFNILTPKERIEIVKEKGLCFACFGQGHRPSNCHRKRACSKCGRDNHHYLLHVGEARAGSGDAGKVEPKGVEDGVNELKQLCKSMCQLLTQLVDEKKPKSMEGSTKEEHGCVMDETICTLEQTRPKTWKNGYWIVPAWAEDPKTGKKIMINVGLDPFAGCTVVSDWLLDRLECETKVVKMQYDTVSGASRPQEVREATLNFRSIMEDYETKGGTVTTGRIPGSIQVPPVKALQDIFPSMRKITFQEFADRKGIDVLMGSNFQRAHQSLWDLDTAEWEPLIRMTHFGPTCMFHRSTVQDKSRDAREEVMLIQELDDNQESSMEGCRLDRLLENTFSLEAVGILSKQLEKQWNRAEQRAWEAVKTSVTRLDNGHWQCGVPWKNGRPELPKNYHVVKKLQDKLEKKMERDGKKEGARKSFDEWKDNKFIRRLGENDDIEEGFYIPWFVVMKDSESTAVRPVLHCAMPFGGERKSLNDEILPGPKLHTDLIRVLLNMRRYKYALMCDISKMYMQFALPPEDQIYHRILYEGEAYQFEVLPFGNRAAPFMALYTLQHHVRVEGDEWMRNILTKCSYVDDLMMSFPTVEEAKQAWKRINQCLE